MAVIYIYIYIYVCICIYILLNQHCVTIEKSGNVRGRANTDHATYDFLLNYLVGLKGTLCTKTPYTVAINQV